MKRNARKVKKTRKRKTDAEEDLKQDTQRKVKSHVEEGREK